MLRNDQLAPPHAARDLAIPASDFAFTAREQESVEAAMAAAWSTETRRAYAREWRAYLAWCESAPRQPLPASPETVSAYLSDRAHRVSKSALTQACVIIAHMHERIGVPSPTKDAGVRFMLKGARRIAIRRSPETHKDPLTLREMQKILVAVDQTTLGGKRDAALLLFGWASAMRRSEIVAVNVEDCRIDPQGVLVVSIPYSKTDQEGKGAFIAMKHWHDPTFLPLCPVCALRSWATAADIRHGPIFRGVLKGGREVRNEALQPIEVARIVKKYAEEIGLDPARFGGHSLRAGHVTEAFRRGISEVRIMAQTRHRSLAMLARYRREADPAAQGTADMLDSQPRGK